MKYVHKERNKPHCHFLHTISGLFHKLEEEVKVNTYMVNEKIPKELHGRKKYVQDVEKVVSEPAMGQSDIDALNDQVCTLSYELHCDLQLNLIWRFYLMHNGNSTKTNLRTSN